MHNFSSPIGRLLATRARTAALAVVVVAAVSMAYASIPDSAGVIHGCYLKINGQLRVIDTAVSSCTPSETLLQWSQTGPQGPEGPQGPPGPEGPSGSTAFGGFAEVIEGFGSEGVPDVTGTIGTLQLPAGKYAIFAKVNLNFIEDLHRWRSADLCVLQSVWSSFPQPYARRQPLGRERLAVDSSRRSRWRRRLAGVGDHLL